MREKGLAPIVIILTIAAVVIGYVVYSAENKISKIQKEYAQMSNTPSPAPQPPLSIQSLDEILNSKSFTKRQFDVSRKLQHGEPLFQSLDYPQELVSINENDLVGMRCTPGLTCVSPYESCSYYPEGLERSKPPFTTADQKLLTLVKNANNIIDKKGSLPIEEIQLCEAENNQQILRYQDPNRGGGGGGTDHISLVNLDNGSVKKVVTIDEPGAYFGCNQPIQLTKDNVLYYQCYSEGKASIYSISLNNYTKTRILYCETKNYGLENPYLVCE